MLLTHSFVFYNILQDGHATIVLFDQAEPVGLSHAPLTLH